MQKIKAITNLRSLGSAALSLSVLLCLMAWGCTHISSQNDSELAPEFAEYWYAGNAELTRYTLEQARYGEIHDGEAVLIFVTEDFLTDKQVKFEGGERGENVKSVLKLNATRKFYTGIYPYSMMTSVFSPVDGSKTLKVTTTSQEWCGHTFSQLNLKRNRYQGVLHSYFMDEGDQQFSVNDVLLEDEIWTRIRLDPDKLPIGNISLVPNTMFLRLNHREFDVESAEATIQTISDPSISTNKLKKYRLVYQDFHRTLEITFDSVFPHTIYAWEEEVESGFGKDKKTLTTKAVRTHSMNSPYWGQHNVADAPLRKKLGLE